MKETILKFSKVEYYTGGETLEKSLIEVGFHSYALSDFITLEDISHF